MHLLHELTVSSYSVYNILFKDSPILMSTAP